MDLLVELSAAQDNVLQQASEALRRSHLKHYEASGPDQCHQRLEDLFVLVLGSLRQRTLGPICSYAQRVAAERFDAGFDIGEVQTAFNVLEEAIWHNVITELPAEDLAEATGLIGTILGAGKDTLARTWVSLATSQHHPSLDLTALFEGASS